MVFGNGVKNIQAAAYNGAHTVSYSRKSSDFFPFSEIILTHGLFQRERKKKRIKQCQGHFNIFSSKKHLYSKLQIDRVTTDLM